ncbi:hypothetical protein PG988_004799 [Apiospora saccharicola]
MVDTVVPFSSYDAARSQMTTTLVKLPELVPVRHAQPVVRAVINQPRLYVWLGLNGLVPVSAFLVAWARSRTRVVVGGLPLRVT